MFANHIFLFSYHYHMCTDSSVGALTSMRKQVIFVATGAQSKNFNGVIKLNESGLVLWNKLTVGADKAELVDALLAEDQAQRLAELE